MSTEQSATIRRLRLFVVILCLSNLLLGCVSFYFLHKTDAAYSQLVRQNVPALHGLVRLSREVSAAQRSMLRSQRLVGNPTEAAKNLEIMQATATHTEAVERVAIDPDGDGQLWLPADLTGQLSMRGRRYREVVGTYVSLFQKEGPEEAVLYSEQEVRPAYEAYQDTLEAAAAVVEKRSRDLCAAYSAGTQHFKKIVLGIAGWPVLIAAGLLGIVSIVLLVMVLLTHRLTSRGEP